MSEIQGNSQTSSGVNKQLGSRVLSFGLPDHSEQPGIPRQHLWITMWRGWWCFGVPKCFGVPGTQRFG